MNHHLSVLGWVDFDFDYSIRDVDQLNSVDGEAYQSSAWQFGLIKRLC